MDPAPESIAHRTSLQSRVAATLVLAGLTVGAALFWPDPPPDAGTPERPDASHAGRGSAAPAPNPCDDSDPCTVDRLHRFRGGCIHVPDALCTGKPCASAADCAFDAVACLEAACHEGTCRYLRIAADECTACSDGAPCRGTFCDPRVCRGGFCRHAPRDCDDGDPSTRDRCDPGTEACVHHRESTVPGRPFLCTHNTDCIHREGEACWAGPCRDGFCEYRRVEHSDCQPCTGDHDCQGIATFCRWPICTGTVCVVEEVPFCLDDNPHTRDSCSEERKGCLHRYTSVPPACTHPVPDDGDPGTVDACHTETGQAVHLPRADAPCSTTNRCWDVYPGPEGACLAVELHCYHDDACPASCDPARGCVLDEDRDCHCATDADCELGNPCARVFCLKADGGACWGTFIDGCVPCRGDADCVVDRWCVLGTCSADGWCTYRDGRTCDDGDPNTFGFCHGQRDDACTYERIYESP